MFRKLAAISALLALTSESVEASRASDAWDKITGTVKGVVGQDEEEAEEELIPPTLDELSTLDWAYFAAGFLAGFSEMLVTKGVESACVRDTANLVGSGVHAYDYMTTFIDSNQTDNTALAYGLVYIVDFTETSATWNCDNFGEDLNEWLNTLGDSFSSDPNAKDEEENTDETMVVESRAPIVLNHDEFEQEEFVPDDPDAPPDDEGLEDINLFDSMLVFETIRDILTDIEVIMILIETGIHSNSVWDSWKERKYYAAGYHLGMSGMGVGVLVDDIYSKYQEMALDYDLAEDLTEEDPEAHEEAQSAEHTEDSEDH